MKIYASRQNTFEEFAGKDIWIKCDVPEIYHDSDIEYGDYAAFINIVSWGNPVYYRVVAEACVYEPDKYYCEDADEVYTKAKKSFISLYTIHQPTDTLTTQEMSEICRETLTKVSDIISELDADL